MGALEKIAVWLVIIGAINWGLVGIAGIANAGNWNVVNLILGSWPMVENIVYVLVGLSGLWKVYMVVKK